MHHGLLTVKVVKKSQEATDIQTFELADVSGESLPPFSAGSHIDVHVRDGLVRQYSLCNDPVEQHRYLIGVLRDPNTRGGSKSMHDDIREGDVIQISEPRNHFPLAHEAKRSLLFAGGIGVTPILCMAERLANVGADFRLYYFTRSHDRTAFYDRIQRSGFADRTAFHFDDAPPDQQLNIPNLLSQPDEGTHLYVCGPGGFLEFVRKTAKEKGWADARVHFEYFSADVQKSDTDAGFEVKIASTGKVYIIPNDKTVVKALAEAGVEIPTSCEQGVCGTCLTRVIEGQPDHRDHYLTDDEQAANDQFLPCCSRAKSKVLVLDL